MINDQISSLIQVAEKNAQRSEILQAEVVDLSNRITLTNQVLERLKLLFFIQLAGVVAVAALGIFNRLVLIEQRRTTQTIESCTKPGEDCYQVNAKRTAEAVAEVVDSNENGVRDTEELLEAIRSNP